MKKFIALLLGVLLIFGLSACGDTENPGADPSSGVDTDTNSVASSGAVTDSDLPSDSDDAVAEPVPNLIMGCPEGGPLSIYDIDSVEPGRTLDDAVIWSSRHGLGGDMKYREDTVFGDVIVSVGGGGAVMFTYPEDKLLWSTSNAGNNPHSIEILPNGDIVVANSTGCTLRYFTTSVLANGGEAKNIKWKDFEFTGAHGVLWDPEYKVLWAVGDYELAAFLVRPDSDGTYLIKVSGMGAELPKGHTGGHDLSADYSDSRYLYLTENASVQRFDKENNKLILTFPQYKKLSGPAVKGFCNNQNNNFFITKVNNGKGTAWAGETYADWCTDRLIFGYWARDNFLKTEEYISETGAFYKMRVFVGSYQ